MVLLSHLNFYAGVIIVVSIHVSWRLYTYSPRDAQITSATATIVAASTEISAVVTAATAQPIRTAIAAAATASTQC